MLEITTLGTTTMATAMLAIAMLVTISRATMLAVLQLHPYEPVLVGVLFVMSIDSLHVRVAALCIPLERGAQALEKCM